MHNLIQEVVRIKLRKKQIDCSKLINAVKVRLKVRGGSNPLERLPLLKYGECILQRYPKKNNDVAVLANMISAIYIYIADWESALEFQRISLNIKERLRKPNEFTPGLSFAYANISIIYKYLGKYNLALKYAFLDLEVKEKVDATRINLAKSFGNVAMIYEDLSELDKSLEYHLKSNKIREEEIKDIAHPDYFDISTGYSNIALVYLKLNQLDKAYEYEEKSIRIREELSHDRTHTMLAQSYDCFAMILLKLNRIKEAEIYEKKAIYIRSKISLDNLELAISLNNYALIHLENDKFVDAKSCVRVALKIRRRRLNNIHLDVARSFFRYAQIFFKTSEHLKATYYIEETIAIYIKMKLKKSHLELVEALELQRKINKSREQRIYEHAAQTQPAKPTQGGTS